MGLLAKGDAVAIILPASHFKDQAEGFKRLQKGVQLLESWGLDVIQVPDSNQTHFYLAGKDSYRSDQLNTALNNPKIRAIFCARGGYGASRIVNEISLDQLTPKKLLIGFSDITTLHLALYEKLCCIHAPNLVTNQMLGSEPFEVLNREFLYDYLFMDKKPSFELASVNQIQNETSITGKVIGGNLTLIAASLGTPYTIQATNKIMLVEEVSESPYKIDRMLTQLKNANQLSQVKALVFGDLTKCYTAQIEAEDIIKDFFKDADYPVFISSGFGHGEINKAWAYGSNATICCQTKGSMLLF